VRAFPGWGGGLTARHSVDSMRRHKVTGTERTSDASSASGAPTCASHRMRQRIPAQCARGGPATPADGYYSVLCGNCTRTLPNSSLTTLLCRWMTCMQSRETRALHRAASAYTFNRRCAANLVQTTHRTALGVVKGTEGYSTVLGCWMAPVQSAETRAMHRVASAHTFNRRCAANLVQTMHWGVLRGTHGYSRGAQGYSAAGWHA
jgi:hypothetical protein